MHKRTLKFIGFDGTEEEMVAYFNISPLKANRINAKYGGSIEKYVEQVLEEKNTAKMVDFIEDIVLEAYGERSEDGMRFIQNEEVKERFRQTLAFESFIYDLLTDNAIVEDFVNKTINANKKTAQNGQNENIRDFIQR